MWLCHPSVLSMPMKRSRSSTSRSESGVSSGSDQGPSKRTRDNTASQILVTRESSVDQNPLRVYIISAKLSSVALENLVGLVEKSAAQQGNRVGARRLALTADSNRADVLVTAVHTRPRLERHVRWEVAVRGPSCLLPHSVDATLSRKQKPSSLPIG